MAEVLTNTPDIDEALKDYLSGNLTFGGVNHEIWIDEIPVDGITESICVQYQGDVPGPEDNVSPISRQRYMVACRESHPKTAKESLKTIRDLLHRKENYDLGTVHCTSSYADGGISRLRDEDTKLYFAISYFIFILREDV